MSDFSTLLFDLLSLSMGVASVWNYIINWFLIEFFIKLAKVAISVDKMNTIFFNAWIFSQRKIATYSKEINFFIYLLTNPMVQLHQKSYYNTRPIFNKLILSLFKINAVWMSNVISRQAYTIMVTCQISPFI